MQFPEDTFETIVTCKPVVDPLDEMSPEYLDHISEEGDQAWNQHPDGCWYCGSAQHHSQDCRAKDGI